MESRNIALQGTLCTSGSGVGVCVGLGDNTVFGRIAKQASSERPGRTTLEVEVLRFVLIIATMALGVALLIVGKFTLALLTLSSNHYSLYRIVSFVGRLASERPSRVHFGAGFACGLCIGCSRLHPRYVSLRQNKLSATQSNQRVCQYA